MTRYLCISVTFLDPFFHGCGDDDESEWPPSPMRLFQALLAGDRIGRHRNARSESDGEALRWLETQEPPEIVTPTTRQGSSYTLFVPNNDSDKEFDRQNRLTSKLARPRRLLEERALHYLWTIAESDWQSSRAYAESICRKARKILALGWGIDQVVCEGRILPDAEAKSLEGLRWLAWNGHRPGQPTWRVPISHSLDDLEQAHDSFLKRMEGRRYRPPIKPTRFDVVTYKSSLVLPPRSFAEYELPEGVAFRHEDTNKVAAMLRSLACRCAKDDTHRFPGGSEQYVAGHTGREDQLAQRFSYLPLPAIGHKHADGMIRRVLIAEPFGGDGAQARWIQQRLRNQRLHDLEGNERGVLADLWRTSSRAVIQRYVGESREWSTVTPIVLPGHDDGDPRRKAPGLLIKAVEQAGLPPGAIEDFQLRKAPFWPGAQHPRYYQFPDYLKHLPAWHVWICFREAVTGPLSIGAGRHCGLGLMATADSH
jgi:CRISPR-associated protein Csb2